jgi:iron complex outermembrane recepter protein
MEAWTGGALALAIATASIPLSTAHGAAPAPDPGMELESIVVTAQRIRNSLEAERDLTPGGVTVIDGRDLYRRNVGTLADLLRYVPGVWSESSSGSDEVFFSSRGSNLDATDYDKNGVKLLQE